MDTAMLIEIFGYIGSVLVVVSMLMSSVVKLRVINVAGSIISGTYALIIGSFPLALMNICLIVINVYNLYKLLKTEQKYDFIEGTTVDTFMEYFLDHYRQDILTYFPEFEEKKVDVDRAYMVCCDGNPAGLLLGKDLGNGVLDVVLDYSTPTYRDCSVGVYGYGKLPTAGVKKLQFGQNASEAHAAYLTKMGFVKGNGMFVKNL